MLSAHHQSTTEHQLFERQISSDFQCNGMKQCNFSFNVAVPVHCCRLVQPLVRLLLLQVAAVAVEAAPHQNFDVMFVFECLQVMQEIANSVEASSDTA